MPQTIMQEGTKVLTDKKKSGKERPWVGHKIMNELLSTAYISVDEHKAQRLRACATLISFVLEPEGKKLRAANFCRVRLCPMCTWRTSLKVASQMHSIMDAIKADRKIRYIMLTLTVKNCEPLTLGKELDRLGYAFNKLTKTEAYKDAVRGYYRAVEVTHNLDEDTYHPHIHAVLAVNPSYFTHRTYISHGKWTELWQRALKADYTPIVHVQQIHGETAKAVAEVAKYATKPADYIIPGDWDMTVETVGLLDKVLAHRRFIGFGGIFKDYHKRLNLENAESGDLVHVEDTGQYCPKAQADAKLIHYAWFSGYRQYRQVER